MVSDATRGASGTLSAEQVQNRLAVGDAVGTAFAVVDFQHGEQIMVSRNSMLTCVCVLLLGSWPGCGTQSEMEKAWAQLRAATKQYASENKRVDGYDVLLHDLNTEDGGPLASQGEGRFDADGWSVDLKQGKMTKLRFGAGHNYHMTVTFDYEEGAVELRQVDIIRDTPEESGEENAE